MYNPMGDKQLRNERCSVKIFAESTTIFRLKMKRLKNSYKENCRQYKGKFLHYRSVLVRLRLQYRTRWEFLFKPQFGDSRLCKGEIRRQCFVAPNCGFYTAGHPVDYPRRNAGFEYAYPITVGDNVWIGGGVQVMPGVTIGSNVVIGGGSVVVKNIPSDCVAVGNPCKPIRKITDEDMKTCFDKVWINNFKWGFYGA